MKISTLSLAIVGGLGRVPMSDALHYTCHLSLHGKIQRIKAAQNPSQKYAGSSGNQTGDGLIL
jgi:hypothetical protein